MKKIILTGMTKNELGQFVAELGEKSFRGNQLYEWIYAKKAGSFDEMTNLSKTFREKLADIALVNPLTLVEKSVSKSTGSIKYLFALNDDHVIESVFIPDEDRRTLCISSQVGCALDCDFCATGKLGFTRNLNIGEIVAQVLFVENDLGKNLTNIVFMGMGEPFNNYENVIKTADLLNDPNGVSIGVRHIVISTAGVVPKIEKFTQEKQKYKLAVSLNSPFVQERQQIMPITKRWSLNELLASVKKYTENDIQRPTFEYVLMAGLNDTEKHAHELKRILKNIPCKVNIIPYNAIDATYKRPSKEQVQQFVKWLNGMKWPFFVRWSKGDDIDGACGQLAGKHKDKS